MYAVAGPVRAKLSRVLLCFRSLQSSLYTWMAIVSVTKIECRILDSTGLLSTAFRNSTAGWKSA
eukprot:1411367-Pleurochrysis_carterae.AAC.1